MSAAVAAAASSRGGPSAAHLPPQRSLSDNELAELYSNCVRLASENRINTKNVWLLPLIDYLDVVMRKQCSGETANFQLAGTTLEASMKIYSSRVDAVHGLGYHMLGGLSSGRADRANDDDAAAGADNDGSGNNGDAGSDAENDEEGGAGDGADARAGGAAGAAARGRTRKSRAGQKTLEQNPDALLVRNLESHYAVDPLFRRMAAQFDEGGARGLMLNQLGTALGCRLLVDAMDSADASNAAAATNNAAAATAGPQSATPMRPAAHAALADDAVLPSASASATSEGASAEHSAAGVPIVAVTSASASPSHHTQAAAPVQQAVSAFDADGSGQRPFDDFDAGGPGFSDDDDGDGDAASAAANHSGSGAPRGAGPEAADGDEGSNEAGADIARLLRVNETVRGARASVAFADGVARSPGVGGVLHTPMGAAVPGSATRSASAPHTPGGGPLTPGVPVARVGNLLLALDTTNEYSWLRTDKLRGWAGVSHWKFRASAPARRADGSGDGASIAAAAADGARAAGADGTGSAVAASAAVATGKRAGAGNKRGKDAAAFTIDFLADTPEKLFRRGSRAKKTIAAGAPAEPLTFPEDVHFEASSLRRPFLRPACVLRSAASRSASRRAGSGTTPRAAGAGVTFADAAASGAAELVLHDARVFAGDATGAASAGAPDHADDASDHDDGDFGGPGLELDHAGDAAVTDAAASGSQSQGATQPSASQTSVAAGGLEIVAQPRAVARIDVKYAERATNVDVHKLKEGLWTEMRALTKGYKEETTFNHLLGCAPRAMPEAESADVTLPYVFICMLHLANEHGLQLDSSAAMDNISIKLRAPRT